MFLYFRKFILIFAGSKGSYLFENGSPYNYRTHHALHSGAKTPWCTSNAASHQNTLPPRNVPHELETHNAIGYKHAKIWWLKSFPFFSNINNYKHVILEIQLQYWLKCKIHMNLWDRLLKTILYLFKAALGRIPLSFGILQWKNLRSEDVTLIIYNLATAIQIWIPPKFLTTRPWNALPWGFYAYQY